MKIETFFTLPEVESGAIAEEATVVVIDVVRATTTIVEALANGARAIFPTATTEEAVRLASSLGREDTVLCGERKGHKVEGFDLGNSPHEFTREAVEDKKLVMSTTNGTRALHAAREAGRVLPCAFTNLGAVAEGLAGTEHLVVICAGRQDRFSLDDALCAGHLVQRLVDDEAGDLNDASRAVRALASARKPTKRFLALTAGGKTLIEIGLEADLDICSDVDRHPIVVEMTDNVIRRAGA